MTTPEKKLSKSTNWKTFNDKLKLYSYSLMLISTLGLTACGAKDLEVTKKAKIYQNAIENVKSEKKDVEKKETAVKKAEEELKKARQDLIEAEQKAKEAKQALKQENNNL